MSKSYDKVTRSVTEPKSASSNRIAPLFDNVAELLKGFKRKGDLVFHFIGKTACSRSFRRICDRIGFGKMSLHVLRHTFATRCLEAGVEGKVVQKWLGHAKYSVTIDTYSHVNSDFEDMEIGKINERWRKND